MDDLTLYLRTAAVFGHVDKPMVDRTGMLRRTAEPISVRRLRKVLRLRSGAWLAATAKRQASRLFFEALNFSSQR